MILQKIHRFCGTGNENQSYATSAQNANPLISQFIKYHLVSTTNYFATETYWMTNAFVGVYELVLISHLVCTEISRAAAETFPPSAKEINDRICLGFYKSPYIFHPFHHSVSRQLLDIVHNHSNTLVILKKPHLCWSIRFHTICILHHLKCFYYSAANWAPSRRALRQISVRHDWERAFLSFPRFRNLSSSFFFPPKTAPQQRIMTH